jgi:galactosylceramidase
MKRVTTLTILTILDFAVLSLACIGALRAQSIKIDGQGSGGTFEGIGAVSAGASSRLLID